MQRFHRNLMSLGLATVLTACGDGSTRDASTPHSTRDLARTRATETILADVSAVQTNGGINPDFFAVTVAGSAYVAANACEAAGLKVSLVEKRVGDSISVVALRERLGVDPICHEKFDPVYKALEHTVRAARGDVKKVFVKNVATIGNTVNVSELLMRGEIILDDVVVNARDGGINPDSFAYLVKAEVESGANPCLAAHTEIEIVQIQLGNRAIVKGLRKVAPDVICTMEYNPQRKVVTAEIRGFRSQVQSVLIKNVDELGRHLEASELIVTR